MAKIISLVDRAVLPLPKLKKVAAYARVSSGKDEMLHSLSAQVSYYSQLIQNHVGWEYVGVYSDKAYTGTKNERPQFQKLLSDCKLGKIDMIITKSISRFARNTLDTLNVTRSLKDLGVDVYFEREKIHSISSDGELMLTILASFAQEESLSASENCKWRIRKQFQNGELANLRFLFGYDISNGNIKINENNASIVRWIFEEYANGTGCTKIAKTLKKLGVPTLRGGKWTANSVRNILLNEKYSGNALLQKKFVSDHLNKIRKRNHGELPRYYAENTHTPIIDKDMFDKVNALLEENRKKAKSNRKTPNKYAFTGKIKCLTCGKNYKRRVYKGSAYWSCQTHVAEGKNACPSKQIPEEVLKKLASEVLNITKFDENLFTEKIDLIEVSEDRSLDFIVSDKTKIHKTWHYTSRSESWTEEKRQAARERALRKESKVEYSEKCNSHTCNA